MSEKSTLMLRDSSKPRFKACNDLQVIFFHEMQMPISV